MRERKNLYKYYYKDCNPEDTDFNILVFRISEFQTIGQYNCKTGKWGSVRTNDSIESVQKDYTCHSWTQAKRVITWIDDAYMKHLNNLGRPYALWYHWKLLRISKNWYERGFVKDFEYYYDSIPTNPPHDNMLTPIWKDYGE